MTNNSLDITSQITRLQAYLPPSSKSEASTTSYARRPGGGSQRFWTPSSGRAT